MITTQALSRFDIANFMDALPATAANRYRSLLSIIRRHAVAKGLMDSNPVEKTLPRTVEIQRTRLSLNGYKAIQEQAEPFLRNAMDLSLVTLRRRKAICETPYRANRVLALLSKMFSLAVVWAYRADNPAKGIERYQEAPRERFLSPMELERLSTAGRSQ